MQEFWNILRSFVTGETHRNDVVRVDVNAPAVANHLPPMLEIQEVDISFQSWIRPVISAHLHGVTVNVVIQKGDLPIPLPFSATAPARLGHVEKECHLEESAGIAALLIGDMAVHEVLQLLPKPPEVEGLFPRIGVVNITNLTLALYYMQGPLSAKSTRSENERMNHGPTLNLLMTVKVPDEFFFPVVNVTLGEYPLRNLFRPERPRKSVVPTCFSPLLFIALNSVPHFFLTRVIPKYSQPTLRYRPDAFPAPPRIGLLSFSSPVSPP